MKQLVYCFNPIDIGKLHVDSLEITDFAIALTL